MIHLFYYTWNSIDGVEEKLNQMEIEGYRVERVYFNYFFSFTPKKNTSKRNSTYMITCSHRDVIDWRLTELEYYLRRYYRMNDVPTSCSNIYLWRIGKKVQDEESLDNIADLRYGYFIRERLVHKIPLEMICLLVAFAISIFKIKNEFISIAIGILLGSRFVWNTFMLFDLVKKRYCIRKRINE